MAGPKGREGSRPSTTTVAYEEFSRSAQMLELADRLASGASALYERGSSNLPLGTKGDRKGRRWNLIQKDCIIKL